MAYHFVLNILLSNTARSEYIISSTEKKMMFQILGVFAEYEREIIVERTKAGLRRARREGKTVGRPRINGMADLKVKRLRDEGLSIRAIDEEKGISIGGRYQVSFKKGTFSEHLSFQ